MHDPQPREGSGSAEMTEVAVRDYLQRRRHDKSIRVETVVSELFCGEVLAAAKQEIASLERIESLIGATTRNPISSVFCATEFSDFQPEVEDRPAIAFRARDTLQREVTLISDGAGGRLQRGVRLTAGLNHAGIIPVHGVGRDEQGRSLLVRRRIKGTILRSLIQELHLSRRLRRRRLRTLLTRMLAVCQTIEAAHTRRLYHLHLSSESIVLGDYGETYVLNWDFAQWLQVSADEENTAFEPRLFSCPDCGAPVSARGVTPSVNCWQCGESFATPHISDSLERADVFQLGTILFEILTGFRWRSNDRPWTRPGASRKEFLRHVRRATRWAPRPVVAICSKAIANDQRLRYQSTGALATDLKNHLSDLRVSARRESALRTIWHWKRRDIRQLLDRLMSHVLLHMLVSFLAGYVPTIILLLLFYFGAIKIGP